MLSVDYWAVEQASVSSGCRWRSPSAGICHPMHASAATSTDPTLLNLARRQGWLISSKQLTPERFERWEKLSQPSGRQLRVGEDHWPMPEQRQRFLQEMVEASPVPGWTRSQTYLIPIDDLQPQR